MIDAAVSDGIYASQIVWGGMVRHDSSALLAASFPVKPPRAWFDNPGLEQVSPLTIDDSGRVFGHIASWRQSHIGLAGAVKAPRSRSDYAYFATGAIMCDDGAMINVGQITLAGGHAPLEASVAEAVAHYDNTRSAIMDVAVGEDKHGIWVAGALRPDVNDLQLRAIRASSVSGDWRPINGNLELVAVCAVNVPGFPIPRARVASGQVVALVAAGTEDLVTAAVLSGAGLDLQSMIASAVGDVNERLMLVEDALLDRVRERRAGLVAAVDSQKLSDELRARVHGVPTVDPALVAALRDRVHTAPAPDTIWTDQMPIELSTNECVQASLRARVASGIVSTATSSWNADTRKSAADKGQALPDGSYPIKDKTDWRKARQALGRAKNREKVVRHLRKRGRALGIPKEEIDRLSTAA